MLNQHGVRDREMWFYYTQWALTSQQKKLVDDIISMEPTSPDEYDLLKRRLPGLYNKGEQERSARFCQLPDLGSQWSSKLLAEMRALYPRGEEGSNVFCYDFFFQLPPTIQALLGEDDFSSVTEMATRTDVLTAATARSTTTIHAVEEEAEITVVRQENSKKTKRFSRQRKGRNAGAAGGGGTPQGGPKPWEQLGMCYAHYRYGSDAYQKNCRPGCAKAEN
jgi:hypothetical protein